MHALVQVYQSTIGKKFIVALTGLFLIGFVVVHMLGNLQTFLGAEKLDAYAHLLKKNAAVLWGFRLSLLGAAFLHVATTLQLVKRNRDARPKKYSVKVPIQASLASRMMVWGGITLLLYTIYHILHFTAGSVHPDLFVEGKVYGNVVRSFQDPLISGIYIVAQIALFFHLRHGFLSAFQTMGLSNENYVQIASLGATLVSAIVTLGFLSVPLGVLMGFVK